MIHFRNHLLTAIAVLSLSFSCVLQAQDKPRSSSLGQAAKAVAQNTGGQILSADTRIVDGKPKYRIKVLTPSGLVRIIYIDAQ